MRNEVTKEVFDRFLRALAAAHRGKRRVEVLIAGGGTAVAMGFRPGTIDVDVGFESEDLLCAVPRLKNDLNINIEFSLPDHHVPALAGHESRRLFIREIGKVRFYHYDPYSQVFAKLVRQHRHDLADVESFFEAGVVEPGRMKELVSRLAESDFLRYPHLTMSAVIRRVQETLEKYAN